MNTDTKNGKGYWTTPGTFYRTRKGSKAHASAHCANQRRSIFTGDILAIPAGELGNWSGCQHCCDAADMLALVPASVRAALALCDNSGVTRPGRIYSHCRSCGKEGKVSRSTGKIKAHAPLVK